jgi:hypothetical protein
MTRGQMRYRAWIENKIVGGLIKWIYETAFVLLLKMQSQQVQQNEMRTSTAYLHQIHHLLHRYCESLKLHLGLTDN